MPETARLVSETDNRAPLIVGVDVGGTFTDAVVIDAGGNLFTMKVPSDTSTPSEGVLLAANGALAKSGASMGAVDRFVHGTTVGTNAIVERAGARLGVLMTSGFEDTLAIGRFNRKDNYDLWFDEHTPVFLAARRQRRGIEERIDFRGDVLIELDETGLVLAIDELVREEQIEAVAICFLFSFKNPVHELRSREIIAARHPGLSVSLSCEINPEIREYERLCVTAFDAYIRPVMAGYLSALEVGLATNGLTVGLQVMESGGGIVDVNGLIHQPCRALMSGPAAGVIGALSVAADVGISNVISIDIGGTSSDVAMVIDGRPAISREGKIADYPIRTPMVDVNSIGAGGGSIAWFDTAGGLHVGPQSAGASPGPSCYGRGGELATVTDASVVLGYVNPEYFAGGTLELVPELAETVMAEIGSRLGASNSEAAWGVHRILNANMSDQIRLMSVGRGHDPRRFALVALGGAGPVHACEVADELGIETVLVPATPGVLSAYGLLQAPMEYEQTTTFLTTLERVASDYVTRTELRGLIARHEEKGTTALTRQGNSAQAISADYSVDMRYVGQSFELEVPLGIRADGFETDLLATNFAHRHGEVYGHQRDGHSIEIVNVRTVHRAFPRDHGVSFRAVAGSTGEVAAKAHREVRFERSESVRTPIYERNDLPSDWSAEGPLIIEQADTTTVIPPKWMVRVHESGHLLLARVG